MATLLPPLPECCTAPVWLPEWPFSVQQLPQAFPSGTSTLPQVFPARFSGNGHSDKSHAAAKSPCRAVRRCSGYCLSARLLGLAVNTAPFQPKSGRYLINLPCAAREPPIEETGESSVPFPYSPSNNRLLRQWLYKLKMQYYNQNSGKWRAPALASGA